MPHKAFEAHRAAVKRDAPLVANDVAEEVQSHSGQFHNMVCEMQGENSCFRKGAMRDVDKTNKQPL